MARLLLDAMLGKLASYLRMCGHDAAYALDRDVEADDAILRWATEEDRRLVTRDRQLAARAEDALLVEPHDVEGQLREVAAAGLELSLSAPSRCANCNGELRRVRDGEPTPEHAPDTDGQPVWRCRDCGQHFWRGSHWEDVGERLQGL
jgi:uncharacterized protein with PIN domain